MNSKDCYGFKIRHVADLCVSVSLVDDDDDDDII